MRSRRVTAWISLAVGVLPAVTAAAAPPVVAVYPSGDTVHENLLRISIRFSAPFDGLLPPRIALVRQNGGRIEDVFDREVVWSPDGTILTMLLGPGRVKTGLTAHETLGRALAAGELVSISLERKRLKTWRVTAARNRKVDPASWKVTAPPASTVEPLLLSFSEPIDGMDQDFLIVLGPDGGKLEGSAALGRQERQWRFTPSQPWLSGVYSVLVNPHLEDPCGNSVSGAFEAIGGTKNNATVVRLPLRIG